MDETAAKISIELIRKNPRPKLNIKIDVKDDIDEKEVLLIIGALEKVKQGIVALKESLNEITKNEKQK